VLNACNTYEFSNTCLYQIWRVIGVHEFRDAEDREGMKESQNSFYSCFIFDSF
jgi:hypothetical protein